MALVNHVTDFNFYSTNVALWSLIETGLAIVACSLGTLRPLFQSLLSSSVVSYLSMGKYGKSPKSETKRCVQSGSRSDRRSQWKGGDVELDDFKREQMRGVVTTTIVSSRSEGGQDRLASRGNSERTMVNNEAEDLSWPPLPQSHGDWPRGIVTTTVEIHTQSAV